MPSHGTSFINKYGCLVNVREVTVNVLIYVFTTTFISFILLHSYSYLFRILAQERFLQPDSRVMGVPVHFVEVLMQVDEPDKTTFHMFKLKWTKQRNKRKEVEVIIFILCLKNYIKCLTNAFAPNSPQSPPFSKIVIIDLEESNSHR